MIIWLVVDYIVSDFCNKVIRIIENFVDFISFLLSFLKVFDCEFYIFI